MRVIFILVALIVLNSCSFDNKTGIWKNENDNQNIIKKSDIFSEFKTLTKSNSFFNETIKLNKDYDFSINKPKKNYSWNDIYYHETNNLINFEFNNQKKIIFKSKKLSRKKINEFLIFEKNFLILTDDEGNIIVYSINDNRLISKFNFYKKRYKQIKKNLNIIVKDNKVFVADNIGYLYAYDINKDAIVWAKNYKIPFRSNLKIKEKNLIASNQNNDLFFFDINNGNNTKLIPSEESIFKNQFRNNLALDNQTLFFINTYGTLYSIDTNSKKVNWVLNLNQSLDINPSSLFSSTEIIKHTNKLIISSDKFTYVINSKKGIIEHKKYFSSKLKPIIINNVLFSISQNNLLLALNLDDGKIIYSYRILNKINKFKKFDENEIKLNSLMLVNNQIYVFLNNKYILEFNIDGNLNDILKLPNKMNSYPIIVDGSFLYINKKNKLVIFN